MRSVLRVQYTLHFHCINKLINYIMNELRNTLSDIQPYLDVNYTGVFCGTELYLLHME